MKRLQQMILSMALAAVCCFSVAAQNKELNDLNPERYEALKSIADRAYDKKEFEKAYDLYRNVLAAHGDAYSQYMTGYMLRSGIGIEKDPATGVAWMILGAQQGNYKLYKAANAAMAALSPGQERKADKTYKSLRRKYSRCALKEDLIQELKDQIGSGSGANTGGEFNRISMVYGEDAFSVSEDIMQQRLKDQRHFFTKGCVR